MYEPTLFQSGTKFSDELLIQFAHDIIRNPHDRNGHAIRAFDGDWGKAAELLNYAQTSEFNALLMKCKKNLSEMDKTYTKEQFLVAVQDKMNTFEGELWLKTAQFYAKLMGWAAETAMVQINNNVIAMPPMQTANDWERGAVQHQRNLQDEARVINE